ncbi:MAG TPA: hypothetical protein VGX69_10690 [Solirubrobacteraceae bacterium]|nr:hypothetical protein [Solirubrobacteraceae bacterium]
MTTASITVPRLAGAPKLRLLPRGAYQRSEQQRASTRGKRVERVPDASRAVSAVAVADAPTPTSAADAPVLLVGRNASRRSATIAELGQTMPSGTKFAHASTLGEVLVLAGSSRMVILSGDLADAPSASLMPMLSHRYPTLPVVAFDDAANERVAS